MQATRSSHHGWVKAEGTNKHGSKLCVFVCLCACTCVRVCSREVLLLKLLRCGRVAKCDIANAIHTERGELAIPSVRFARIIVD